MGSSRAVTIKDRKWMNPNSNPKQQKSLGLGARLLLVVLCTYLIIVLASLFIQMYLENEQIRINTIEKLKQLHESYQPGLQQAIWTYHDGMLQAIALGITESPEVTGTIILNHKENVIASQGNINSKLRNRLLEKKDYTGFTRVDEKGNFDLEGPEGIIFPIMAPIGEGARLIGTALVLGSETYQDQLLQAVLNIAIRNSLINALIISLVIWLFVRFVIVRPLKKFVTQITGINLERVEEGTVLEDISSAGEILQLEQTFSLMLQKLRGTLQERKQAETELHRYQEQLENMVEQRTGELRKQKAFLETVLNSVNEGIVVCDEKGTLSLFNRASRIIHGIKEERLPPEKWAEHYDLYQPDGKTHLTKEQIPLFRAFQGEIIRDAEFIIAPKGGEPRTFLSSGQAIITENGDKVGAVISMHDITDLRETTQKLEKSKEKAEAANRAKSRFLSNMSHELRTPLNAILGFSQLMRDETDLNSKYQKNLETILRSGKYLLGLINNVLQLSKIEAGHVALKRGTINLPTLLGDMVSMFKLPAQNHGIDFSIRQPENIPLHIIADEGKIRQILINLLGNALKFTEQGKITLHTDLELSPNSKSRLIFEVEDTGVGIAKNEQPNLFKPFEQASNSFKSEEGTGLGLAICKEYAHLMGGNITVQSEPGKGSTFRVEINIDIADAPLLRTEPQEQRQIISLEANQKGIKILNVDDIEHNREIISIILKSAGFTVREAVDGVEAVKLFNHWSPDLVFMDIRMPRLDGLEAVKRIKKTEKGKKTPVIAVTANVFDKDKETVRAVGFDDFIGKPINEKQILNTIRRHLNIQYIEKEKKTPPILPRGKAESIPNTLNEELHDALVLLDVARINTVITKITEIDSELGTSMKRFADSFAYGKIKDLLKANTEKAEDNNAK